MTPEDKAFSACKKTVFRLLSRRDYFSEELRTKLSDKGHHGKAIEKTLSYLLEAGWVNDKDLTYRYVKKEANQGRGPSWIKMKLTRKGAKQEDLEEALEDVFSSGYLKEVMEQRLKKGRLNTDLKDFKKRQKAYQLLLRNGFPIGAVQDFLTSYTS